jgi:protein-S-isoprenylcysteine O-methyltransferase Ste14
MWALPAGILLPRLDPWHAILCAVVAGIGLAICFAGVLAFRQSRTTVDPRTPAAASSLVVGGIYRYTRNPMYLGFLLVLLALALYLGTLTAVLLLPVFVFYLNEFQIKPEERALRKRFGTDFDFYAASVRRWL